MSTTAVVEWMPEQGAYRVTVYKAGAWDHAAWFQSEIAANSYAVAVRG